MDESLDRYICSAIPGRARLRHPALKDERTAESLRTFLLGPPGVLDAKFNPRVGSLLLTWDEAKLPAGELKAMAAALLPAQAEANPAARDRRPGLPRPCLRT